MLGILRNPDELLSRDVNGYDLVLANPIVKAEIGALFAPIVTTKFIVEDAGEKSSALGRTLSAIKTTPYLMTELCNAFLTGVRFVEPIWEKRFVPEIGDIILPVRYVPHSATRFGYDLTGCLWMTHDNSIPAPASRNDYVLTEDGKAIYVQRGKMIVQSYRDGEARYGYGRGEAVDLYRWCKAYQAGFSWMMDYAQSYGIPLKVLTVGAEYMKGRMSASGSTADAVLEEERDALKNLIAEDTLVIFGDSEFQLLSAQNLGAASDFWNTLLTKCEDNIRIIITGEAVTTTSQGTGFGNSLAKAREAAMVRTAKVHRMAAELEETLRRDLLLPLMEFNPHLFSPDDCRNASIRLAVPRLSEAERTDKLYEAPFPVFLDDLYEAIDAAQPTDEDVATGRAVIPAAMREAFKPKPVFPGGPMPDGEDDEPPPYTKPNNRSKE